MVRSACACSITKQGVVLQFLHRADQFYGLVMVTILNFMVGIEKQEKLIEC